MNTASRGAIYWRYCDEKQRTNHYGTSIWRSEADHLSVEDLLNQMEHEVASRALPLISGLTTRPLPTCAGCRVQV